MTILRTVALSFITALGLPATSNAAPSQGAKPRVSKKAKASPKSKTKARVRARRRSKSPRAPKIMRPTSVAKPPTTVTGASMRVEAPAMKALAPMSLKAKKALLDKLEIPAGPGSVFAVLSAATPMVPNKAVLGLVGAHLVSPTEEYVRFMQLPAEWNPSVIEWAGTHRRYATLWIKGEAAGNRYLVDCTVKGYLRLVTPNWTLKLYERPAEFIVSMGSTQQRFSLPEGGGNLAFVMETKNSDWHGVRIETEDKIWDLQRCEITRL